MNESEKFLHENFLVPVIINSDDPENPDPDEGKYFLGISIFKKHYRLPFPVFESVEDAAEWVRTHLFSVVLALFPIFFNHLDDFKFNE